MASLARRLGALLVTATMDRCPDIGFDSYDRFFPSQDTMPAGGFGNLIALPLQNRPRENGNSVFLDDDSRPCKDQWAYLSTIGRLSRSELMSIVAEAGAAGQIIGVRLPRRKRMTSLGQRRRPGETRNHRSRARFPAQSRSWRASGLHRSVEVPAISGEPHRAAGRVSECHATEELPQVAAGVRSK